MTLPQPPKRGRLMFDSWDSKPDGSGETINQLSVIKENITVYAQWWLSDVSYSYIKKTGIKSIEWFPYNNYEYIIIHVEPEEHYSIEKIDITMDGTDYSTSSAWSKIAFDPFIESQFKLSVTASALPLL